MEKALYLPTEQSTTLFAVIGNPWALLGIWLVLINLVTFLVFGLDKWKARRKVRNETVRPGAGENAVPALHPGRQYRLRCWACGSFTTRRCTGPSATGSRLF